MRDGSIRRVTFEAIDLAEAREIAAPWAVGVEGEGGGLLPPPELPHAYNEKESRRLLGGISRSTLYNWIAIGRLEKVPGCRRLLLTRESIERAARS